jgi:hypothetical protein
VRVRYRIPRACSCGLSLRAFVCAACVTLWLVVTLHTFPPCACMCRSACKWAWRLRAARLVPLVALLPPRPPSLPSRFGTPLLCRRVLHPPQPSPPPRRCRPHEPRWCPISLQGTCDSLCAIPFTSAALSSTHSYTAVATSRRRALTTRQRCRQRPTAAYTARCFA